MNRIDQMPLGQFATTLGQNAQARDAQKGALQGQTFSVETEGSSPVDSAEEKSLFHAEKAESKSKAKEDVKVRAGLKRMHVDRPPTTEYFHKVKDPAQGRALAEAARQLMEAPGRNPSQTARQMGFEDPVQQFLLLDDALALAQREGAPAETLEALETALTQLERQHGREIRIDLATVDHAASFGEDGREVSAMQTVVRETALGQGSLAQALKFLMDRTAGATGARLDDAIASLRQTLGALIAGVHPDVNEELLQVLVTDLDKCKNLKTQLDKSCKLLMDVFARRPGRQGQEQ